MAWSTRAGTAGEGRASSGGVVGGTAIGVSGAKAARLGAWEMRADAAAAGAGTGGRREAAERPSVAAGAGAGVTRPARRATTASPAPTPAMANAAHSGHRRAAGLGQGAAAMTTNPRSWRPFS